MRNAFSSEMTWLLFWWVSILGLFLPTISADILPEVSQKKILDDHNTYRKQHHVPPLNWSNSKTAEANKWLDTHRNVENQIIDEIGQNLWRSGSGFNIGDMLFDSRANPVVSWYSEIKFYPKETFAKWRQFTQLIWKGSNYLGCGVNHYLELKQVLVVCYYDPPGNKHNKYLENVFTVDGVPWDNTVKENNSLKGGNGGLSAGSLIDKAVKLPLTDGGSIAGSSTDKAVKLSSTDDGSSVGSLTDKAIKHSSTDGGSSAGSSTDRAVKFSSTDGGSSTGSSTDKAVKLSSINSGSSTGSSTDKAIKHSSTDGGSSAGSSTDEAVKLPSTDSSRSAGSSTDKAVKLPSTDSDSAASSTDKGVKLPSTDDGSAPPSDNKTTTWREHHEDSFIDYIYLFISKSYWIYGLIFVILLLVIFITIFIHKRKSLDEPEIEEEEEEEEEEEDDEW